MKSPNLKLLSDLARLASKYDAKDWEQLAEWLDDPQHRDTLRSLLLDLAATSRGSRKASKKRRPRKPSRATVLREALAKIRIEDADRADLLEDIWLKLRQRELLPTVAAVRAFAEAMGSKGLSASRRDQAVTELMELLVELPGDSLEQKMRETVVEDRKLGDEYERWVRLILYRSEDPGLDPGDSPS
jgi:hypothetical protein